MRWFELTWQLIRPYGRYVYYKIFPARRPAYFRNTWNFPPAPVQLPQPPLRQPTFLFFPMNDWHARTQRSQHLANALAESGHLCIYVNPHLGLEYSNPSLFSRASDVRVLGERLLELHVHLPREHELNRRPLLRAEARRIVAAINSLADEWKIDQAVSVVSFPVWIDVLTTLRSRRGFPILYDCHDLLSGFEDVSRRILPLEGKLTQISDRVVYSSAQLMETSLTNHPAARNKVALVRNGVTPADFARLGGNCRDATTKVVGYVGALESWFDREAMEMAARRHPSVKFMLIGAVRDPRILALRSCPNISFVGEVPYSELRKYMDEWSVATIPFVRNALTLATNPIKVYEYFSAGLPVVATRLPELEQFPDLIYLSDTPEQFAELVSLALNEEGDALPTRRRGVANKETWLERANSIRGLVEGLRTQQ